MSDEAEDATQQAYRSGVSVGMDMAPAMVLQVLLRHVLAQADDPDALREELRAEALEQARGVNDGSGATSPFIEGVRLGATDRIGSIFGLTAPTRRQ